MTAQDAVRTGGGGGDERGGGFEGRGGGGVASLQTQRNPLFFQKNSFRPCGPLHHQMSEVALLWG